MRKLDISFELKDNTSIVKEIVNFSQGDFLCVHIRRMNKSKLCLTYPLTTGLYYVINYKNQKDDRYDFEIINNYIEFNIEYVYSWDLNTLYVPFKHNVSSIKIFGNCP